jgi:hypothetical protein
MTPQEYLEKHSKKPFLSDEEFGYWYWGLRRVTIMGFGEEEYETEDDDFLLPVEIFRCLSPRTIYPDCKAYKSEQEAIDDFCIAFQRAYPELKEQ